MKLSFAAFFLAATALTAIAQGASNEVVDEITARGIEDFEDFEARELEGASDVAYARRALEHVRRTTEDHLEHVERALVYLERRSRSTCYAACAEAYSGANRTDCYKKCDAMWGNQPVRRKRK